MSKTTCKHCGVEYHQFADSHECAAMQLEDAVSASNMRHTLAGAAAIALSALSQQKDGV